MSQNNEAYAAALAEIEEGRLDKGAWARAFAESVGDESKAKALYIKARAESIDSSQTWPDTQPPIEDVPKKHVAPETNNGKAIPVSKPPGYYVAALGEKNSAYYLDKFHAFDEKGPGLHASWNWAAFFFTGFWALYRKMYGWFFAWWAVGTVLTVFSKVQNSEINQILGIATGTLWVAFSLYANAIYHRKIKARIATSQKSTSDAAQVDRRLASGSGVNTWAAYVFASVPVIGIVAAIALPAYQDSAKRKSVAATPVQAPTAQEAPVKFWENDKIVTPAQTERGPWEQYQVPPPEKQTATPQQPPSTGTLAKFDPSTALPVDTEKAHFERIDAAHPDAESIVISSDFNSWVAKNPSYRPIVAKGTSQEVIDMLTRYKNER